MHNFDFLVSYKKSCQFTHGRHFGEKNVVVFVFHFKTIYLSFFHEYDQTMTAFCRVWVRLINLHLFCSRNETQSMHLRWVLMLVHCTQPCVPQAMDASKPSARAMILSHVSRKVNKCAFINLYHLIKCCLGS